MSRNFAVFPGSFDPFTNGHLDIVTKASRLFDKLYILIAANGAKSSSLFTGPEKLDMIWKTIDHLDYLENVYVAYQAAPTVDYCKMKSADFIIRGVGRGVSDFEGEYALSLINEELNPGIQTIFIPSSLKMQIVSSSLVRELKRIGKDYSKFVPEPVLAALQYKS